MLGKNKITLLSLSLASLISLSVHAKPHEHIIVAPNCLVKNLALNATYKTLASTSKLTLITTQEIKSFIVAKHKRSSIPCGGFIDVTNAWQEYNIKLNPTSQRSNHFLKNYEKIPRQQLKQYSIQYPDQVNEVFKQLNADDMWSDLTAFTNTSSDQFPDRYPNSATGIKAATWLQNKIDTLAKEHNRSDISIYTVATGTSYKQPSVVVKIGNSNEPGIIIGGHMDTLSSSRELKPGADDDGSGSMTVMGIAKALIKSDMHFKKPIYIIWYSAEEQGLVGSSYVVKDFKAKKIPVYAVIQFDMTGYAYKNDPTLWIVNDYVNSDLTRYLSELVKTYVKQPVGETRCGYACSDHASWYQAGFTASFPFEASFNNDNPYIHTSKDKMNVLSLSHMSDYAKLGLAFAVELAEPASQ